MLSPSMGCQATFQILFLFLWIAAVEANDCHLRELNINTPPPLSAAYDRLGASSRKPEPSLINEHHDLPLETGSGSYSTAETSSQGQYHNYADAFMG